MELARAIGIIVTGCLAGFLGGMFGKGGSAIATPLLHAVGVPAFAAVASPLPATVPSTLLAARRYRDVDLIDRRLLAWTVGVGAPLIVLGGAVSQLIGGTALVTVTELILLVLGLQLLSGRVEPHERAHDGVGPVRLAAVAGGAGFAAGMLANAGGFLLAPLFVTVLRRPLKVAFGTSLAASAALAIPGTIAHAALGHIDWVVAGAFAAASVPLASLGARVALRTRTDRLERRYGAFLIVTSLLLLVANR